MDGLRTVGLATALALLLALSPVAALPSVAPSATGHGPTATDGEATAAPPVVPSDNTTAYLALREADLERTAFQVVRLDAAGATAIDRARLDGRYTYLALVEAFDGGSEAHRRAVLQRSFERVQRRADALDRREREALSAYNAGDLSTRAYLRELAAIEAGAEALSPSINLLYRHSESLRSPPVTEAELASLKVQLLGLDGPVRNRITQSMRGDARPTRVYVETTPHGVVLTTVVGEAFNRQFVREVYLPSARDTVAPDQFFSDGQHDLDAAERRARELYPWAFANQGGISTGVRTGQPYLYRAGAYSVAVDHPHGTARQGDLVAYLDGGTANVFREIQYKDLSEIPTDAATPNVSRRVSDGLLVQVNRTHEGGPLEVRVRDAESGDPVSATVSVDGDSLGSTGVDGRVWTVTPRRAFNVTATVGDRSVTAGPMFPRAQVGG